MGEKKAESGPVSFRDYNARKKSEGGFEVELLDEKGQKTGTFATVIGAFAPAVQKWVNKELNDRRRAEALQAKRGKVLDVRPIEEDIEFGIGAMACRVIAWRPFIEPCTFENVCEWLESNPHYVDQLKDASEELGNFTKG